MKIKDIEKSLKKESDIVVVPDVYSSVKAAPINRLLTGETPIQAFKKQLVLRLMVFAILVFVVALFAFAAMALTEPVGTVGPDSYVSFSVSDGTRYGFVVASDGIVKLVVKEKDGGSDTYTRISSIEGKDLQSTINEVYYPVSTDKVTIYALCSKGDLASYWSSNAKNYVLALCINGKEISQIVAMPNRESEMINYINSKVSEDNKVAATDNADDIVAAYLSLF